MYLAVAVETSKHPNRKQDYKIWYLEVGTDGKVQGVGVKNREELIESIFTNYRQTGKTNWRCFQKEKECSTPIEIYDFIAMNSHENTHFGDLPSLSDFQLTLDSLQTNLELRSIA